MRRVAFALAALALLVAACATPDPGGTRTSSASYEVRTDPLLGPSAERIAAAAERAHAALRDAYNSAPQGAFTIVVYGDRARFDAELTASLRGDLVGECRDGYALVFWPDERRGEDTLAHELVHRFDAALLRGAPPWLDEGLAKALAPKRDEGDALSLVAALSDDELRARVRSLPELPDGPDYALRTLVAAALVRFGLETQGFADVTRLRAWQPDTEAFLRWLRDGRHEKWATSRFAPVWERQDSASRGSERIQRR